MFGEGVFWLMMGMVSIIVIVGVKAWTDSLRVKMTWWKWAISVVWYVGFLFSVAVPATFMGEGEVAAGGKMIIFSVLPAILMGFGVWRVINADSKEKGVDSPVDSDA